MPSPIRSVADRKTLSPRREPYWDRLEAGCFLGFRKLADGTGTWIARWRDSNAQQRYRSLHSQPDYDTAAKAARTWFAQCKGGSTEVINVEEACRRYVNDRMREKGASTANDAAGRFERLVYGTPFGRIKLEALRTAHVTDWRNTQVAVRGDESDDDPDAERRTRDSANRNLASLKAALNLAYRLGLVSSTAQWDRVASFKGVSKRRDTSLTLTERKKLLAAASADLKVFVRAMLLTGCRPGELAATKVGGLNPCGLLTISESKTAPRTIPISPAALELLSGCAAGRPAEEPLLTNHGQAWSRFDWRDEMQAARTRAGLPPSVVMYSLRHVAISEMLVSGIDPMTAAKIAGTSIEMISRHYGHLIKDKIIDQLAKVQVL